MPPKIEILAYSGGPICPRMASRAKGPIPEAPIVLDLSTITAKSLTERLPINWYHEPETIIGHSTLVKVVEGRELVRASIEASWTSTTMDLVPEGKRRKVNGREQSGPFLVCTKPLLTGCAIVYRGADRHTSVKAST